MPVKKLVVCDLGSIETRVTGWVSGCDAILKVFREGRDAYVDFGTRMDRKSYDELNPDFPGISKEEKARRKDRRQIFKPAVLGCGYGLGGGDLEYDKNDDEIRTGLWGYAQNMGIEMSREESHDSVQVYRREYSEVCQAWRKLERAAIHAVKTGETVTTCNITFDAIPGKLLRLIPPSGCPLHYIRPAIGVGEYGDYLYYEGVPTGYHGVWGTITTWGGKIMENTVQKISRDILAGGLLRAHEKGFTIVGHCHDEIICEEDVNGSLGLEQLRECMIVTPQWAPDLLLDADGWEGAVYRK